MYARYLHHNPLRSKYHSRRERQEAEHGLGLGNLVNKPLRASIHALAPASYLAFARPERHCDSVVRPGAGIIHSDLVPTVTTHLHKADPRDARGETG